jgi:hypothetical protein
MSNTHSVVNDLVVRPCKAFSHAVLASLRGTLGYRALTSKQNMIKGSRPGKVQGNPKMHKKNNPCRVIINGNKHSIENMAEIVENELAENVLNLNSYIKDTTIHTEVQSDCSPFCLYVVLIIGTKVVIFKDEI